MLLLTDEKTKPKFNLRSDDILGAKKVVETEKSKGKQAIFGSVLSGVSVFLMAGLLLFRRKGLFSGHEREDVVFYILVRIGLHNLAETTIFPKDSITYLRTSDVLLSYGLHGDAADKDVAVKALKCLLLVKNMAEESRKIIIGNVKVLEGDTFSPENIDKLMAKSINVEEADLIRDLIGEFISDPDAFLNMNSEGSSA